MDLLLVLLTTFFIFFIQHSVIMIVIPFQKFKIEFQLFFRIENWCWLLIFGFEIHIQQLFHHRVHNPFWFLFLKRYSQKELSKFSKRLGSEKDLLIFTLSFLIRSSTFRQLGLTTLIFLSFSWANMKFLSASFGTTKIAFSL